jgi:hypothetical protein
MEPIVLDKFGTKLFVNDDSGIADNSLLHFYQISGEAIGFHTCGADFLMYAHSETHNGVRELSFWDDNSKFY